jgi:hypothetical protein
MRRITSSSGDAGFRLLQLQALVISADGVIPFSRRSLGRGTSLYKSAAFRGAVIEFAKNSF